MASLDGKIEFTFSRQDRELLKRIAKGIEALNKATDQAKVKRLEEIAEDTRKSIQFWNDPVD